MNYKQFSIGDISINGAVALAPIAGYTEYPFRNIVAEYGCPIGYTPLVSARGLMYRGKQSLAFLERGVRDCDVVGLQIFGTHPEDMAIAGELGVKAKFDFIDINLGCPAPKVRRQKAGAMLTTNPRLMADIVCAVKRAVDVPVTAKIRVGIGEDELNGIKTARVLESEGIDMIAVHGRTLKQMFGGSSNTARIAEIVSAVSVPVLANGDITTPEEAKALLENTGAAGVMVGRAALRKPYLISQCDSFIKTGKYDPAPDISQIVESIMRQFDFTAARYGEIRAAKKLRKQIFFYIKGFRGARELRGRTSDILDRNDVEVVLREVAAVWEEAERGETAKV